MTDVIEHMKANGRVYIEGEPEKLFLYVEDEGIYTEEKFGPDVCTYGEYDDFIIALMEDNLRIA